MVLEEGGVWFVNPIANTTMTLLMPNTQKVFKFNCVLEWCQDGTRDYTWVDLTGLQMRICLYSGCSMRIIYICGVTWQSPQQPSSLRTVCYSLPGSPSAAGLSVRTWKCRVGGLAEASFLLFELECGT